MGIYGYSFNVRMSKWAYVQILFALLYALRALLKHGYLWVFKFFI